ncbi:MAG: AEC family transporter [Cellulosilyticaceae bacterium]
MENFILSFNVVLPLFLTMSLGYGLKRLKMFDASGLEVINKICFRVFLPLLLFNNIYKTDLQSAFNLKLISFATLGVIASFILLMLIIPIIEKDNPKRGVMIQGIFRSNFIIFGLPIVLSLFGEAHSGVPSLVSAVVIPLFNALSIVALEMYRGGKVSTKKILKGVVTNPLIIGSVLGILLLVLNIKLPSSIEKTISDVSKIATPLSLIVLGGYFTFSTVKGHLKQLLVTLIGRLILLPCLFIPLSIAMGFRDVELVTLIVLFGAPTAVSSFTMAQQMNGDSELAGHVVVFGSALAVITIFVWIFVTKQLGYI